MNPRDARALAAGLSERSGIAIPEADTPQLRTLRGLLAYLGHSGHARS